ncbi:MAG: hypothetical protein RI988_1552 [Pseudomonadota bacterium]
MCALRALKIDPPEYLRFVKSMDSREEPFAAPRRSTLRPLTHKRLVALEDSAALFEASRRFRPPAGIALDSLRAMRGVSAPADAPAELSTSQSGSTLLVTRVAMPASGFSALEDTNALPGVSDACRARDTAWLGGTEPRAFVIGRGGHRGFTTGTRAPQAGGAARLTTLPGGRLTYARFTSQAATIEPSYSRAWPPPGRSRAVCSWGVSTSRRSWSMLPDAGLS